MTPLRQTSDRDCSEKRPQEFFNVSMDVDTRSVLLEIGWYYQVNEKNFFDFVDLFMWFWDRNDTSKLLHLRYFPHSDAASTSRMEFQQPMIPLSPRRVEETFFSTSPNKLTHCRSRLERQEGSKLSSIFMKNQGKRANEGRTVPSGLLE